MFALPPELSDPMRTLRFLTGDALSNGIGFFSATCDGSGKAKISERAAMCFECPFSRILAMDMPIEERHVLIRREHVHHLIAVAREPLPVRPEVRTAGDE